MRTKIQFKCAYVLLVAEMWHVDVVNTVIIDKVIFLQKLTLYIWKLEIGPLFKTVIHSSHNFGKHEV